jgi:hypothetical protein
MCTLRYTWEGPHEGTFSLDQETGALRLDAPLDYEGRHFYNVSVRASDDGSPPLSAVTRLLVVVSGSEADGSMSWGFG